MDPSRIHEDITRILYRIEEQYSQILQHKDRIPLLEVDLVLKDISTLYECVLDLRTIAEHQRRKALQAEKIITTEVGVEPVESKKSEPITEKQSNPPTQQTNAQETAPVEKSTTEKEQVAEKKSADKTIAEPQSGSIAWQKTFDASKEKPEGINKPAASPVSSPAPSVPPQVTAPKVDLLKEREKDFVPTVRKIEFKPEPVSAETKKESIFDKAASLYDKIAKPAEKTVAVQAGKQPISNIKSSIGINEKFIYLKDLFRNNVNDYNEALDKLNNYESYADAEDYFQELKLKYNWDPEGKSFQGLAELLNRRYLHSA